MAERECQRSRSLKASFRPWLPNRLDRLLFDSGKPGRPSIGETVADRLDELLIIAGLGLLLVALFVDSGHPVTEPTLRDRLTQWRRDRRWYSKQLQYSDDDGWF
jgi:hypothetical protein